MKKIRPRNVKLETIHEDEELSLFEPTYEDRIQNLYTFLGWVEHIFPCLFAGQGDVCGFRV